MFSLKSVAAGATALALLATSATAETAVCWISMLHRCPCGVTMQTAAAEAVHGAALRDAPAGAAEAGRRGCAG